MVFQNSMKSAKIFTLEIFRLYGMYHFMCRTIPDCFMGSWRKFLSSLINISSSVAELVTPVVCNSSPEGCLPDQAINALKHVNIDLESSSGANAQSLVICCWHCMKEISLLLGDIVEKAPLVTAESESSGLITIEQVFCNTTSPIIEFYS